MIADLYNFITSLGKLNYGFAKVFIAISRICIIGLGLLDVFPISTTTKQNKSGVYDGEGKNILFIASTCRILVAL
jgi:hypothetical protein